MEEEIDNDLKEYNFNEKIDNEMLPPIYKYGIQYAEKESGDQIHLENLKQ